MTAAEYQSSQYFPLTHQAGLTLDQQLQIDACNYDEYAAAKRGHVQLDDRERAIGRELEAKHAARSGIMREVRGGGTPYRRSKSPANYATSPEEGGSEQEHTSADTSLNQTSAGLKYAIKAGLIKPKSINVDIGGGKYDTGMQHVADSVDGAMLLVFDPFNREKEHNHEVEETGKGASEYVGMHNVLNVLKKPQRITALEKAKSFLKPGTGVLHITTHEGNRSGRGAVSKPDRGRGSSWQEHQPLSAYIPEIERVFPSGDYAVDVKGRNILVSQKPKASSYRRGDPRLSRQRQARHYSAEKPRAHELTSDQARNLLDSAVTRQQLAYVESLLRDVWPDYTDTPSPDMTNDYAYSAWRAANRGDEIPRFDFTDFHARHREATRRAMLAGVPVPGSVLASHPGLASDSEHPG